MARIGMAFIWLTAAGLVAQAAEPSKATVRKLAQEVGDATVKQDYAKVIDLTYDAAVKQLGGREKAIQFTQKSMALATTMGIVLKDFKVGEPGQFYFEGGNTFVVVPTTSELASGSNIIHQQSYLLGISPDGGKTWKFVGGTGLAKKEQREKILPKLPANLKLPEQEKP